MRRQPALAAWLPRESPDTVWAGLVSSDLVESAAGLRDARERVALIVALADLAGAWTLEQVCDALSQFADRALDTAIRIAAREAGLPSSDGFVALALGKLGARELNYSSDIDLIFLFDRERMSERAAVAMARRATALLADRIAGRYVFRVDLRLRPASEATPPALSTDAALAYYQSEALTWERIAFIRARPAAGDVALGARFLDELVPFVWRRSLDFAALDDIRQLSRRMRDAREDPGVGPGYDLKRGRGGIREIEFFAHAHQLIFGGREPALRVARTVLALDALAASGHIPTAAAEVMANAYRALRTLEHRLQMRADEQTHRLPDDDDAQRAVAALAGLRDWPAVLARVEALTAGPAHLYRLLLDPTEPEIRDLPRDRDALRAWLRDQGAFEIDQVVERVAVWRSRRYRALRAADALDAFEAVLPDLLRGLLGNVSAPGSLARFDAFLAALPAGVAFFRLLAARPALVDALVRLLGVTPVISAALARRPDLFDVLLEGQPTADARDPAELERDLDAGGGAPFEAALDRARRWTGEQSFLIGARLTLGELPALAASRAYAAVADTVVRVVSRRLADEFAATHGRVAGGGLVTLAYGRFGGGLLTARSDLDLVFLFTGSHETASDGQRPLGATHYFNRLAQRLVSALSVATAAGPLYPVDTRLRPSGAQGLLAVSLDHFGRYQRDEAWTWERMALTRARVVGHAPEVDAVIHAALDLPRDPEALRDDVLSMRAEMAAAHPDGGAWDVKHGRGGLIDLEFIVHFLQLRDRRAFTPDLAAAIRELGLADGVLAAHDLMTAALVVLRLLVADGAAADAHAVARLTPAAKQLLAQSCGAKNVRALGRAIEAARVDVLAVWSATFGEERT